MEAGRCCFHASDSGANSVNATIKSATGAPTKKADFQPKAGVRVCIATAATNQVGSEGSIFRFVFWHSVALAAIVGTIVMLYAYVFKGFVPGH